MAIHEAFPATVARVFLAYGPGQATNRLLPQVILACLRNVVLAELVLGPGPGHF